MTTELHVSIQSHHFACSDMTPRAKDAVLAFARRNTQYGMIRAQGRWIYSALRVFGAAFKDRSTVRFHINQLTEFKAHLIQSNIDDTHIAWVTRPLREDIPATELPIKPEWTDRPDQTPVIEYITREEGSRSRFVDLQTGKGKSYCAMRAAAILRAKAVYLFRPAYLDKWVLDIRKTYDIPFDGLMTVQGSAELKAFLMLVASYEIPAKVVLISNRTFQNYLKMYEEFKDKIIEMGYACTPPDFFEFIGSTLRVIDEVHQDFHLNYRIDLYTHVQRSLSLSATFFNDDDFLINMYNVAYPPETRYVGPAYDKYVAVRNVFYQLRNPQKVRFIEPATSRYSHNVYEHSIMRNRDLLENYIRMLIRIIDSTYMVDRQEGDKGVIFCASIDFCGLLTERLKEHYTKFSVMRYVGSLDDPYDNLMLPDLRVSTHGSAGTAVDIPQLTLNLMTQAMRSSPGSLQNLGRLRKLPDGRTPLNVFVVCTDIPQHIQYHEHRLKLLEHRAASMRNDTVGAL